ncbi:MAG TPA: SDR family oxidoreductase, partial [Bradyrhizobium sp.]|nr:SDR family oxidoreductase [Bradyrhizobium sp.]
MAVLQGRHALVTGGGRGIGRAIAAALSAAGATVTVVGRTEKSLQEVTAAGEASGWIVGDVTEPEAMIDNLRMIETVKGPVDILVANAGGADSAPFSETEPAQFRRMFELNVMGVVSTTQAVLNGMIERKFGRVIAVASTAGVRGYGYVSAYCSAKHAVVGLVRSLAIETAKTGVTVNAVCPGYTDTEMMRESVARIVEKTGRTPAEAEAAIIKNNPLGRFIKPQEV